MTSKDSNKTPFMNFKSSISKSTTGNQVYYGNAELTHIVQDTSTYADTSLLDNSSVTVFLSCGVSKVSDTTISLKNSSSSDYKVSAMHSGKCSTVHTLTLLQC